MADPTIGPLIRALRVESGRSQAEQAALLSDLSGQAITRNEVSRWEREGRLLTPFWQAHYAESFGVHVLQIRQAVAASRRARDGRNSVRRRQFIGAAVGLALPLPDGRRIGHGEVAQLYRHTAQLRRLDNFVGGADTYPTYMAAMNRTVQILGDAAYTSEVGRSLRSLLAEQAQLAGWSAFDAGNHSVARSHYRASLDAATEAGDAVLAGNALAFLAYQMTTTARSGVETATTSYVTARAKATPRVRALLLERLAWSNAVAGQAKEADAALSEAREALADTPTRAEPDWVFWVDSNEIDIMSGRCWTELRRPLRAVPVLETALDKIDDTFARDKALYLTWLATAYLQAGEIERSAATAAQAVGLATGVASARPLKRVEGLARQLTRHRTLPAVAEFLDQLTVHQ